MAISNGSSIKKTKVSNPEIDGYSIRFEWEGDKAKWIRYSEDLNCLLVETFISKKQKVDISVGDGNEMTVMFDKMVQRNKSTGWERRIRVCLKGDKDSDFMTHLWQDESNSWCSYCVDTCLEITKAIQEGNGSIETETTFVPFKLDLKKMTQTNIKTGFSRKIKRAVAVSAVPIEDEKNEGNDDCEKDDEGEGKKIRKSSRRKKEIKQEIEIKDDEDEDQKPKSKPMKSAAKSRKLKKDLKEELESKEDDDNDEELKPKSGRAKSSKSTVRTVVVKKGGIPVDSKCPMAEKASVYQSGKVIWDCMLNQTNIANNNNKYFLLQLLKEDDKNNFYVWFRWGRVGYDGQNALHKCGGSLDAAMKTFQKKFQDKTKNDWNLKDEFVKYPGKYDLLQMDYNNDKTEEAVKEELKDDIKVPDSKLDDKLQKLIKLICDVKSMEDAVVEMKYDAKKVPLGKLTKEQIKAGYAALKEIDSLIANGDIGRNLSNACSEFYTRIPHEFGMQVPAVIRTKQMVKEKIKLLEALEDIEIAITMLKGGDKSENPIDRNYHQLDCKLTVLDHEAEEFKLINKYLQQTHAATHMQYKMELMDVFCCEKSEEISQYTDHGNRMLLWHGSRLTNWAGILGQGLRIAPPEAPVTGYMFGKGVYFADMSSKSANYCFTTKTKNVGLMMLCDVSLGTTEDKLAADYDAAKLPKGKNSVRGLGKTAPDPKDAVTLSDGVVMPLGKGCNTGINNPSGYTLNYNEFIVYDTKQIRMKYLVQIKFVYK